MMTPKGNIVSCLFTVLLFHAAVSDDANSSKTMTIVQRNEGVQLEPKAPVVHWSINSGKSVEGEFVTKPGAFKYVAMLEVESTRCSGAVISPKFVMSSTQCFSSKEDVGFAYVGGITYREKSDLAAIGVQVLALVKFLLYTETQTEEDLAQHDLMLVSVVRPGFKYNEYVQPVRLTDQRRFSTPKPVTGIVVGFGGDQVQTMTVGDMMKQCPKESELYNVVCSNKFRPCNGDAGAAIVSRSMLVGVLRKENLLPNDGCNSHVNHSVQRFTFVGYYRDWIVEHSMVSFGVWPSGSQGYYTLAMSGTCRASYVAVLLLHIWKCMFLK